MSEHDNTEPFVDRLKSDNGRDAAGRFAVGNSGGPGNPGSRTAVRWRQLLDGKLTDADLDLCLTAIRDVLTSGKPNERLAAAEGLLDRVLGKAVQADLLERLEALEAALAERRGRV